MDSPFSNAFTLSGSSLTVRKLKLELQTDKLKLELRTSSLSAHGSARYALVFNCLEDSAGVVPPCISRLDRGAAGRSDTQPLLGVACQAQNRARQLRRISGLDQHSVSAVLNDILYLPQAAGDNRTRH